MKVRETEGYYVLFFFSKCKLQYKGLFLWQWPVLRIGAFLFKGILSDKVGKNIQSEHLTVYVNSHYM